MADKLPSASFHLSSMKTVIVFPSAESVKRVTSTTFPVLFVTLLDRILVNALYRDHGIAEASLEGRLRSVQPRSVTLPGWVGEAEGVAFQLQAHGEFILGSVHTLRDLHGMANGWRVFRPTRRAPNSTLFFRAG
jgi:hypothetical protein